MVAKPGSLGGDVTSMFDFRPVSRHVAIGSISHMSGNWKKKKVDMGIQVYSIQTGYQKIGHEKVKPTNVILATSQKSTDWFSFLYYGC